MGTQLCVAPATLHMLVLKARAVLPSVRRRNGGRGRRTQPAGVCREAAAPFLP